LVGHRVRDGWELQAMNVAVPARAALGGVSGLIRRHKVISSLTALFVAAVVAVSLLTSSSEPAPSASSPAAPGFSLPALGGQAGAKVSLAQYAGQPVIVNFWASWCDPCQQETPLLASWYKAEHGKTVLLGLDENDPGANALKFARAKGITYPMGSDPNVTVATAYGINGLPQTFFLNGKHQIVDHVVGAVTTTSLAKGVKLMNAAS
jgi:cytochrome c biogenesis protein CcmG, thiol:disulfide interchange protein DsbE